MGSTELEEENTYLSVAAFGGVRVQGLGVRV